MTMYPMKLVTIICEALAREPLTRFLDKAGAHGYTLFRVEGTGAKGSRVADMEEFANIQVEVVVTPEVAERLMGQLQREFFARFAMIAFESDVRVLRSHKF